MTKEKEYTSLVTIKFDLNINSANSKKEYIEKVKNQFKEEFNISLMNSEITEIEEVRK